MNLNDYLKEGVSNEKIILKVLEDNLPNCLKIKTRKNPLAGFDAYCILIDDFGNEINSIKLELESTLTMKYWTNKIPPIYRWSRGLSIPIRKYNDKWDVYIKFSHTFESFWATEFNYFNKYAQKKVISNVAEHVRKDNDIFMDLQWNDVRNVDKNDMLYNGNAICIDNYSSLSQLLIKKLKRKQED